MKFVKFYIWNTAGVGLVRKNHSKKKKKKNLGKSKTLCNRREILLEYFELKGLARVKYISS